MEKEFEKEIAKRLYHYTIQKQEQYNKDNDIIDIPECYKLFEDKITTKAANYVNRLIAENRLHEVFITELCC